MRRRTAMAVTPAEAAMISRYRRFRDTLRSRAFAAIAALSIASAIATRALSSSASLRGRRERGGTAAIDVAGRNASAAAGGSGPASTSSENVHMIVVADANFERKYRPLFESMDRYASARGYLWHVIGTDSPKCEARHRDFFFRKHCMIAEWMKRTVPEGDVVFVFDSDVVPYRSGRGLEDWADRAEDVLLYERKWNTEIAAGNYMARNNRNARAFLRGWANYEREMPTGFSSSDNGAIHLHVLRVAGYEEKEGGECGRLYRNLTAPVTNLTSYYAFVECTRRSVVPSTMEAADGSGLSIGLLKKGEAWVIDGVFDEHGLTEYGPVFHHGVKLHDGLKDEFAKKYGLNGTERVVEVSCGRHVALNCTGCPQGHGELWCNGECAWFDQTCVLKSELGNTSLPHKDLGSGSANLPKSSIDHNVSGVNCGQHRAQNCWACPQGNGANWCNGECVWIKNECVKPLSRVNCGQHQAQSCSDCPQGNGALWCHGDCIWSDDECIEGPTS